MDIRSGCGYPASKLSNFTPHKFEIDGVKCNSMEGFLQSLKFKDINMQKYVCGLTGKAAKFKGKPKKWWITQTLWWKGIEIDRHSKEYQELLDRAYSALFNNEKFKKALMATQNANLTHSIGKRDASHTILTTKEFCGRLMKLRNEGKL
jgi:hypothetical protein